MPVPKNGKDGKDGKNGANAPTIESVAYADNQLTFSFSDGNSKSTPFIMPTPKNGKDGTPGKDAPIITSVSYNDDKLTFNFSDGSSKSTSFKVSSSDSDVKDSIYATFENEFSVDNGKYYDQSSTRYKQVSRALPNLSIFGQYKNKNISLKKGIKDSSFVNFISGGSEVTFKPIFDELDTKANKTDLPTSESIATQIDQNLKEKLKKNIITKIALPGYLDDEGRQVRSGLSISNYNVNGDSETAYYKPNRLVALDNYTTGYSYNIPILKLSVSDGLATMWLQGSLTSTSRPKAFSIGKIDMSYIDPSMAEIVLSTDNQQGTTYTSDHIQISDQSDDFSGLPVTIVSAMIKENTAQAREAFKQAFSDFNNMFYFLHIEG